MGEGYQRDAGDCSEPERTEWSDRTVPRGSARVPRIARTGRLHRLQYRTPAPTRAGWRRALHVEQQPALAEHPGELVDRQLQVLLVAHGEHQRVELVQLFERGELDAVLAERLGRARRGIVHARVDAELAQLAMFRSRSACQSLVGEDLVLGAGRHGASVPARQRRNVRARGEARASCFAQGQLMART